MADLASFLGGLDTLSGEPDNLHLDNVLWTTVTVWWYHGDIRQRWPLRCISCEILPRSNYCIHVSIRWGLFLRHWRMCLWTDQTADVPTTSVMHSYHNNKTWDSAATVAQSSAGMRHVAGRLANAISSCPLCAGTLAYNGQWSTVTHGQQESTGYHRS